MTPDNGRYDVAVIGGGSAGLAAALTSARCGARTLLVERHGYAGGTGTASLVHTFCGLYLIRKEHGAVLANPGICGEISQRMIEATGIGPVRMGRLDVLPQHPVEFVNIADSMIAAEPMLQARFHCEVAGVTRTADSWEIDLLGVGGPQKASARCMVDASGDAVLSSFLGLPFEMAPTASLQRPAYVFGVRGPSILDDNLRLKTAGLLVEGVKSGNLNADALGLTFRASGRHGDVYGTLDLIGADRVENYNPLDSSCLAVLEARGREVASAAVRWLSAQEEAWSGAHISHWPVRAGIRESRRWIGEYVLTEDDILNGVRFEDEIALATWPMEMRETANGPRLRYSIDDRPAGIPLRCLKPHGTDRLYVAGRCISCDHGAQASIRVMGTCFATGEAAGRAAAGDALC